MQVFASTVALCTCASTFGRVRRVQRLIDAPEVYARQSVYEKLWRVENERYEVVSGQPERFRE